MSRCWCQCEAGAGQCAPKVPKLKALLNSYRLNLDDSAMWRVGHVAELQVTWDDLGEDRLARMREIQNDVTQAVSRIYAQALEEASRKRSKLEEAVAESEKLLRKLLGPEEASLAIAPRALALPQRLEANKRRLKEVHLDNPEGRGLPWVRDAAVLAELQRRAREVRRRGEGSASETSSSQCSQGRSSSKEPLMAEGECSGYATGTPLTPRCDPQGSARAFISPSVDGSIGTRERSDVEHAWKRGTAQGKQQGNGSLQGGRMASSISSREKLSLFCRLETFSSSLLLEDPAPAGAQIHGHEIHGTNHREAPGGRGSRSRASAPFSKRDIVMQALEEVSRDRQKRATGSETDLSLSASESESIGGRAAVGPISGAKRALEPSLPAASADVAEDSVYDPPTLVLPLPPAGSGGGGLVLNKPSSEDRREDRKAGLWSFLGAMAFSNNSSSGTLAGQERVSAPKTSQEALPGTPAVLRQFQDTDLPWLKNEAGRKEAKRNTQQSELPEPSASLSPEDRHQVGVVSPSLRPPATGKWLLDLALSMLGHKEHAKGAPGQNRESPGGAKAAAQKRRKRGTGWYRKSAVPGSLAPRTKHLRQLPAALTLSLLQALRSDLKSAEAAAQMTQLAVRDLTLQLATDRQEGARCPSLWYTAGAVSSRAESAVAVVTRRRVGGILNVGHTSWGGGGPGSGGLTKEDASWNHGGRAGGGVPSFAGLKRSNTQPAPMQGSQKAPPPPPPSNPSSPSLGSTPRPAPPPPPPPPPGSLAKGAFTHGSFQSGPRLKRSSTMGQLFRGLRSRMGAGGRGGALPMKGGSSSNSRSVGRFDAMRQQGSPQGGESVEESLAAALMLEISKKSSYFQQVETDVQGHAASIWQAKALLESSSSSGSIPEMLSLHETVESLLSPLNDESAVLSRFPGFPRRRLELLRTAAAQHKRLGEFAQALARWQLGTGGDRTGVKTKTLNAGEDEVGRAEKFVEKVRKVVEPLERSKDEDARAFAQAGIPFNFDLVDSVKESMVKMSTGVLRYALQHSLHLRTSLPPPDSPSLPPQALSWYRSALSLLWRAFQLSFKVYTFAGGQNDEAESVSLAVASEMERYPAQFW